MTDSKKHDYLNIMGISAWESREAASVAEPVSPFTVTTPSHAQETLELPDGAPPHETSDAPEGDAAPAAAWEELAAQVSACTACELRKTRTQTVFGVGSRTADWMFIGEAPGADEDRQGEPFVGRAGRLLNSMLEAIGFSRDEVYIANILKCRPPNNRDPAPAEAQACEPFLLRQIALIEPRIILAVGRIAAQNLLATTTPIGQMRGRRYTFRETGIPVVVTYHPAYFLRSPLQKRRGWEDLLSARRICAQ
uniref:Type-4 uracil-DNA glycosylase n=1 Tax=Candidatus Kentrum eta TaxID=2126337 RepID=A0A450V5M6_9GAMM|nr:MAG: DNA polymerase [Candidatus Kentron sp. H]VFK00088.1 MAG: DNA polymerase [Candidatus Kentron sp. H]VFK04408.1 MAG: DNA polymerase [Candidatus Kentron sp. H]